jgi:hypothetical protein
MRTWRSAERLLRGEAAHTLGRHAGLPVRPLVAALGGAHRPSAVIGLRGFDLDRPSRTLAELVLLAAAFGPERVLVGMAVPTAPADRRGVLVVHDLLAVPDGLVEVSRAWAWRRVGRRVLWLPAEVCHWGTIDALPADVARAVIEERPARAEPEVLDHLLTRSAAAGHRVRLAPRPDRAAT